MILNRKIWILLLIVNFGVLAELNAQTSRSRRTNRTRRTRSVSRPPVISPNPGGLEPEVISTAEDDQRRENGSANSSSTASGGARRPSATAQKVQDLSKQVGDLNDKIGNLDKQQRNLLELERLTRAEERAENVRRQLDEVTEKEAAYKSKLEQLDIQMQPQNIERDTALIGSTRPEEVRENRRRALESEKARTVELLNKTSENRLRLETTAASADALLQSVRAGIESAAANQNVNNQNTNNQNTGSQNTSTSPTSQTTDQPQTSTSTTQSNTARPDIPPQL